jgi:uncharacterized repeat protein (TIGR03803 family)
MAGSQQLWLRSTTYRLLLTVLFTLALFIPAAQAQTYQVLHSFTGGTAGYYPSNGVVFDRAGNLYGTAAYGGNYTSSCNYGGTQTGCGVIYKMSHHGSGWTFDVLSSFDGANGYNPEQLITIAPDGTLYGTAQWGGSGDCHDSAPGCGTIFRLQPPATFCRSVTCPWTVTALHQFLGRPSDGAFPEIGSMAMDSAGNLYGTTWSGGLYQEGIVYELSPTPNGWTMSVLYNFSGPDGSYPEGGVVLDSAGNLYGVTQQGGILNCDEAPAGCGAVYQLTPTASGWTEHVLHGFNAETDGAFPTGNLVIDSSGNVYGETESYGPNSGGTVWELSPGNGGETFSVLYSFPDGPGSGPFGGLLLDNAGNLYGTTINDGAHQYGSVFKLSPSANGWNYTDLHDFTGGSDGGLPYTSVSMDSAGNLFGVTEVGGSSQNCGSDGCGVVWEITP